MTPADVRSEADELARFLNAPPKAVAALRALANVYELLLGHKQKHLDEPWHRPCRYCESESLAHLEALKP